MSEVFNLDKNILESAKISACKINDKTARIRAYALNIAAGAAAQYLDNHGLQSDTSISLYKIPSFEEIFEVADVYVKGFRLDVRISFDGKTFTIPKLHEKYSVQPLAYIVVKFDEKLEKVEFLGFAPTEGLECPTSDNEYYTLSAGILKPMNALKELIESSTLNIHPYSANNHEKIKELCTPFIDGEISESERVFFIKHVLACPVCRETFCDVNDFDTIISQIRNYQELLNDSTLSVLSGNKKEIDEAVLANMALVENAQENLETEESLVDSTEEFASKDENLEEITEEPLVEEPLDSIENLTEETEETLLLEEAAPEVVPVIEPVAMAAPLVDALPDPDILSSVNLELPQEDNLETLEEVSDDLLMEADEENYQQEESKEDVEVLEEVSLEKLEAVEEALPAEESFSELEELTEVNAEDEFKISHLEEQEEFHALDEEELVPLHHEHMEEDSHFALGELDELEPLHEEASHLEEVIEEETPVEQLPEVSEESLELAEAESEAAPSEKLAFDNEEETTPALESADEETLGGLEELTELAETEEVVEQPVEPVKNPYRQEPVELVYDDEENEEVLDSIDKLTSEAEASEEETEFLNDEKADDEEVSTEIQSEQNIELQSLLDADLMTLLSDDEDSDEETEEPVEVGEEISANVQDEETLSDEVISDENIESLFENNEEGAEQNENSEGFELAKEPLSEEAMKKTKRAAIMAGLLVVLIAAGGGMLFVNHQKTSNDNNDVASGDQLFDFGNKGSQEQDTAQGVSQDINRSMTNSFSDKPAAITITKLSWQVSEKLALDPSVKEYLQTAGKNIQMNLQNDLANSADIAFNNSVKVSFTIAPDNTMKGLQVLESSGSDKIDEVISKSIKNTLKYISVPKLQNHKSDYFLTLIINF